MKNSQIVALMALQALAIPMLAFSWGQFDHRTAIGFVAANLAWQIFTLSSLFGYNKKEKA